MHRHLCFRVPHSLYTRIDLSKPMSHFDRRKAGYRNVRRLISKHGLSYETTRSAAACRDFYDRMYVSYIRSRHKERARILPYRALFPPSIPFELFTIKRRGKVVAGAVVHDRQGAPVVGFFGIMDGRHEYLVEGVLGAAYYFIMREMKKKRGFNQLRLGGSPPFLTQGITRHKIRLCAEF